MRLVSAWLYWSGLVAGIAMGQVALAQEPLTAEAVAAQASSQPATTPTTTTTTPVKISVAERILRLEQSLDADNKDLADLKQRLDDPKSEYAQAKEDFQRLDGRLKEREKELTTKPADSDEHTDAVSRIERLKKARELARERFELAIKENEALQAKHAALAKKIQQDSAALAALKLPASQPADSSGVGTAQAAPAVVTPANSPQPPVTPANGAATEPKAAIPQATVSIPTMPGVTIPSTATGSPTAPASEPKNGPAPSEELVQAQQEAQTKQKAAHQAEETLKSVGERIATLRENIASEHDLLETARKKAANAQETCAALRDRIQKLVSTGAPSEDVNKLWTRLDEAEKRSTDAEKDVQQSTQRLEALRSDLTDLQSEHIAALQEAEKKQSEAQRAQQQVQELVNPYSMHNVLQWLIIHGPRVVGIVVGMMFLLWLTRATESRIVRLIAAGRNGQGAMVEREARAKTLASVFKNVASTAVVCGGTLMLLTEVSINIVPLLGGAAVVGLAAAFGAQSLIKDYFSGFIILLENQYAINDVVKIGDAAGLVERITLRMTVLRDLEGIAHFIPHGEIKQVSNMTHGWSRAVFDVGVAYREQVDKVMEVLMELGRQLRRDPQFGPLTLEDPEMLGVDNLGDSAVVIKFTIKTRPLRQWAIKREMLRRIKNRFDELGIEIPFPHRTLYLRHESDGAGQDEPLVNLPGHDPQESR